MDRKEHRDERSQTPNSKFQIHPGMTLGQALKASAIAGTGGEAKVLIQFGEVTVNGEVETRRGRRLESGDVVEAGGERVEVS